MFTISDNLKAIGTKLPEISRKQTLAQTRTDNDTYLGDGKPQLNLDVSQRPKGGGDIILYRKYIVDQACYLLM